MLDVKEYKELALKADRTEEENKKVEDHANEFAAKVSELSKEYGCALIPNQNLSVGVGVRADE